MKKLIRGVFNAMGLEVRRKVPVIVAPVSAPKPSVDSMIAGLIRARDVYGIHPATVIDLGAAAGTWTVKASKVWTESRFMMFEPLDERQSELDTLHKSDSRLEPVFAAVGERDGKISFRVSDDLDGSGISDSDGGREVPLVTLDSTMKVRAGKGPYVIKFDTHGFELPILEGAKQTLQQTDLIIMECYGFRIASKSLLFHEMTAHMEKLGFRLADVVDIMRRPGDQLFWQCDVFFLRDTFKGFSRTTYAEPKK